MSFSTIRSFIFIFLLSVLSIASAQSSYRIIAQTNQVYDSLSLSWKKDSIAFVYSSGRGSDITKNAILYDTLFHYYSNGSFYQLRNRNIRIYNAQDSILNHTYQVTKGASLQNDEQFVYTYDSNNNKVSEIWKYWDTTNSKWVSNVQRLYSYTANNLMISEIIQIWDTTLSNWRNEAKHSYSYTSQGEKDTDTIMSWEPSSSSWEVRWKVNYTYNSVGKLILAEEQDWINNAWENSNRTEYTYDSNLWLEEVIYSNWIPWTSTWEYEQRFLYTHLANDYYYSVIQQEYFHNGLWKKLQQIKCEFTSFNRIDSIKILLWNSSSWVLHQKGKLFYEQYSSTGMSENELQKLNLKIYPNPALEGVTLVFDNPQSSPATVKIYDIAGRLVQQIGFLDLPSGRNELAIDVQALKSGIYVYELKFPEYNAQGQFVKR